LASYNNRSLFSDYYLEELVSEDSHWRTLKNTAWECQQRISNVLGKALSPGSMVIRQRRKSRGVSSGQSWIYLGMLTSCNQQYILPKA